MSPIENAARVWSLRAARSCEAESVKLTDLGEARLAELIRVSFEAGARWGRACPGDPSE